MSEENSVPSTDAQNPDASALTPVQQEAVRLLVEGKNITAAATSVGVTRRTLHRWLQGDAHFRAAYNAWQQEVAASVRARLLHISDDAVGAVEGAVRRGDARTALTLLREMGLLSPAAPESSDPQELSRQIELDEHERRLVLALRKESLNRRSAFVNMR